MKLKAITLVETITALAVFSVIALGTSMAFSTAGNIFRRSQDIQSESETSSEFITEIYNNAEASSEEYCIFMINEDIAITGELFKSGEYIISKPFYEKEMGDDNEKQEELQD